MVFCPFFFRPCLPPIICSAHFGFLFCHHGGVLTGMAMLSVLVYLIRSLASFGHCRVFLHKASSLPSIFFSPYSPSLGLFGSFFLLLFFPFVSAFSQQNINST